MSVVDSTGSGKPKEQSQVSPEQLARQLQQMTARLQAMIPRAAQNGDSFDAVERQVWESILQIGKQSMDLLLSLQGDGDLGETVVTEAGKNLRRSAEKTVTRIRSIFGEHCFEQFTYSPSKNKRIELRPISARICLPEARWSFLLEEFSQLFTVESAFNQAAKNLSSVLGGAFSVDTLEQTSRRMGQQADSFLDDLPQPDAGSEAKLLVASADCKGVPLLKKDADKVAAFETAKKRPGNRRMATVASVYSIDRHFRTPEQIVDALFREEKDKSNRSNESSVSKRPGRPRPKNKNTTAHFPTVEFDDDKELPISGIHEGVAWLADQIDSRRRARQVLVVLMDGQESLWETVAMHVDFGKRTVGVLDFLHAAVYVWEAASLFHATKEHREAFTHERLLRLLRGEVFSVIAGIRRMGSLRELSGEPLDDLNRICGYFEKHADRMRYDEYLRRGYPIASGVIEGACRHLVKDRMERSGMRWTLEGARSMLNVRAAFQSDHWQRFLTERRENELKTLHPHRNLLQNYTTLSIDG